MDLVSVSKASAEDWEPAMELAWRTFLKYEAPDYSEEGISNFLNFISDEKLYKMFLNGAYVLLVAKLNGKIIGLCSMRSINHISLLFVDEKFHKKGIGKKLLISMQELLAKDNTVKMSVNAAPFAIGFYEKLGFLKTDRMKEADGIKFQPMECFERIKNTGEF